MLNDIFLYVLGFLITLNLLTVWTETNFSVNLLKSLKLIKKDIYLREELEEHLTNNWGSSECGHGETDGVPGAGPVPHRLAYQ